MIQILLMISVFSGLLIASFVALQKRMDRSKYFFLGYVLGASFWGGGILVAINLPPNIYYTYGSFEFLISQIVFLSIGVSLFSEYWFFRYFNQSIKKYSWTDYISFGLLLTLIFLVIYPGLLLIDYRVDPGHFMVSNKGSWAPFLTLYILYFYFSTIYLSWKRFKDEKNLIIKRQTKYLGLSYFIFLTLIIISNWILPTYLNKPELNGIGPIFYIIESSFFLYVITQYRFFDIKLRFLRILKLFLAFLIAIFLSSLVLLWLRHSSNFHFSDIYLFFLEGALVLIFYFQMIWLFDSRFMDDVFGEKSAQRFRLLIDEFRDTHFIYDSIDSLKKSLSELFCNTLGVESLQLVVLDKINEEKYKSVFNYFENYNNDVLVTEEIPYFEMKTNVRLGIPKKIQNKGEVFVPLANPVKGIIGILILGRKKREIYLARELKTLKTFGHYLSLLLTGILYNTDLKDEVKLKTKQLAVKNKKLKDSYTKLKIFDEAKDNFLAIASHELRTPMTVIKGYVDFLLTEDFGKLNKRQSVFVRYIQESTDDLLVLVNDMLDLSKIESGKMEFQYEKISLAKCITSLESGFSTECKQRGIDFSILTSENLPKYMIFDPQKVRLVMTNLIGNAMKFTPSGGSIVVDISRKNKNIKVAIIDTGIGIKKENLVHIFDKFFQAKNRLKKEYKGTGLGLAIVKKILETVGGHIYVKSKVGKGTTFTFELPIREEI